uniref:NADAR domain-containing protein n=1 Tax=viral metagenome TaxID=1070528 RepID=A0A6C0EIE4_9ZZZZ
MTNPCFFDGKKFGLDRVNVTAFYYPGYPTPVDSFFNCSFLSNYYKGDPIIYNGLQFLTAEAAYQSEKYQDKKNLFQNLSGQQAFDLSRKLSNSSLFNPSQAWDIMYDVLKSKFSNVKMHRMLQNTNNSFLLEHNIVKGRDNRWSDDYDGTGNNWLGLLLMLIRDESKTVKYQYWTTWIKNHVNIKDGSLYQQSFWPNLVRTATRTLRLIPNAEIKSRNASIISTPHRDTKSVTSIYPVSSVTLANSSRTISKYCSRPGCKYPKYRNQQKEYPFCSLICAQALTSRICSRPGCKYLKYRNQQKEYPFCSLICAQALTSRICSRPGCAYQKYRNQQKEYPFCSLICARISTTTMCARPGCTYLRYKNQYQEYYFCSQTCAQAVKNMCIQRY